MLLENKYYQIKKRETNQNEGWFHIHLLPECEIYKGHFPGHPVCPGVCQIETVKECVQLMTGKNLSIQSIKQCRFPAMSTPSTSPELNVFIKIVPEDLKFQVSARITDETKTYVEFKGTMTV